MKFFTMDWWRGIQDLEDYDPRPEFQAHLDTIRDRIPADLLVIQETVSLHDANLRVLHLDVGAGTLEMELDGNGDNGCLRQFILRYGEVNSFRSNADPAIGLHGPHGYGDLGYYEIDITAEGKFEQRILFSTGIEFRIVFGSFKLEWHDIA